MQIMAFYMFLYIIFDNGAMTGEQPMIGTANYG